MRIGISSRATSNYSRAFTLVEVVFSAAFVALLYSGIITAYILSARRAEWAGYSLAAQALSMRQLEQVRQAKWDSSIGAQIDEIIPGNFPNTVSILDLPISGTNNIVYATNRVTLLTNIVVSTSLGATNYVKMLRVDTVWSFRRKTYTNSIATYIAPDA